MINFAGESAARNTPWAKPCVSCSPVVGTPVPKAPRRKPWRTARTPGRTAIPNALSCSALAGYLPDDDEVSSAPHSPEF